MDREIVDAVNRLAAATGAAHQAALDLQRALGGEYSPSAPPLTEHGSAKRYFVAEGEKPKCCKGCGATIYFTTTSSGKFMPVNPDGTSHMDTCPERDLFRRG